MRTSCTVTFVALGLWLASASARASEPEDPSIYGGTAAATCAWPTAVSIVAGASVCTGTLVHPRIVIFAAHCGDAIQAVRFAENYQQPARELVPESCVYNPYWVGSGQGNDFAYCLLPEGAEDVPVVPILMGCETDLLQVGQPVTLVGFGQTEMTGYGIKRFVATQISQVDNSPIGPTQDEVWVGGNGDSACSGDSGGPTYLQLADGSWRVFGVTSWVSGQGCEFGTSVGLMHNAAVWIESNTGVDITPCHTAQGDWQPGPGCEGFPLDPGNGGGLSWAQGCSGGEISGKSESCGEPAPDEDDTPPSVELSEPLTGTEFASDVDTGTATVNIVALANDAGWGIAEVRLVIDGDEIAGGTDYVAPYDWPTQIPPGQYVLSAIARDLGGNEAESAPVYIGVDMPAPEPPAGDGDGDGDGDGAGDGDGDGDGGGDGDGDGDADGDTDSDLHEGGEADGCGCSSTSPAAPWWLATPIVLCLRRRRRDRSMVRRVGKARRD